MKRPSPSQDTVKFFEAPSVYPFQQIGVTCGHCSGVWMLCPLQRWLQLQPPPGRFSCWHPAPGCQAQGWLGWAGLGWAGLGWLFHHPTAGLGRAALGWGSHGLTSHQDGRVNHTEQQSSIWGLLKYVQMKLSGQRVLLITITIDRWASLAPTGLSLPADGGSGAESAGESWQ